MGNNAERKDAAKKRQALALRGMVTRAAIRAGFDPGTLWEWCGKDPEFKRCSRELHENAFTIYLND